MNITDKGSIFIVSLFYIITLASGYMIHENQMIGQKNEVERLIITINNNEINTENNSTIVYEDVGRASAHTKNLCCSFGCGHFLHL
jgi:hypothetical protein